MIDYDNKFEIMDMYCDNRGCECEEQFEGSWQACIDEAKESGWQLSKDDGEWIHLCSECAKGE